MPICKREGFNHSTNNSDIFNDNDEVFYCEATKQIFRDYEDYFRHIMSINSTIWQCEVTGKDNLTYVEAIKSERRARKKIDMFKDCLRPVVMLVIEQAKQSSLNTLNALTFRFLRRRYFLNEEVQLIQKSSQDNQYIVMGITAPGATANTDAIYENTEHLQYRLQNLVDKSIEVVVPFEKIRRQRSELTSENLCMFIKNNIVRVDGILTPSPKSYKLYITDRQITFQSIFIGQMPSFSPAKILRNSTIHHDGKKQTTLNKYLIKNDEVNKSLNNSQANNKNLTTNQINTMKDRASERENSKMLKKENERVESARIAREKHFIEQERLKAEKKAKLLEKIEEECTALLTKTDDLERTDQCLLPLFTPVDTLIPNDLLGDAFMLREFMHSFSSILSGIEVFKGNLSFNEVTRALTTREVAGPLSDIFLVLLGTIFDLQREEEEECDIQYSTPIYTQQEPFRTMAFAGKVHKYTKRHFNFKLNELPLDALTLSEVLRLHLLSSGAIVKNKKGEKWRLMYRSGYSSSEDPGLTLVMQQPYILRALKVYSLYQLPFKYIMRILHCLMDQVLTYSNAINLIEERFERIMNGRQTLKNLQTIENQRLAKVTAQQKILSNDLVQQCMQSSNKNDSKKLKEIEEKFNKKIKDLNTQSNRERKRYEEQIAKINASMFTVLDYLGMDRAYRKYYAFESMPGLFVEHHSNCLDSCLSQPPVNVLLRNGFKTDVATLPKNRKDLRAYLLRKYNDEEKKANTIINSIRIENKENKENHLNGSLNKISVNNGVNAGEADNIEHRNETSKDIQPTAEELYMCTGELKNCLVHNDQHPDRRCWSYIQNTEVLEHLLETLNPLGLRESELREQLVTFKDSINEQIKKCPVDKLNIKPEIRHKFESIVKAETYRKYYNSNFEFRSDSNDLNEIISAFLTQRILEFESEICSGDLGKVRVKDIDKWRLDLLKRQYNPQVKLQWGPLNNNTIRTDIDHKSDRDVVANNINQADSDNEDDAEQYSNGKYAGKPYRDPGEILVNTAEDSEAELLLKDTEDFVAKVKQLASALLQVEQGVERRFLKEPFGAPLLKDKELQERKQQAAINRLRQWEISLMECTSYSQVFLHLNLLKDCIMWARSTNKSNCMICRRGTDPEKMLLCDECNGGTHMFCMKPKLKTVPEGNWYCRRCVKSLGLKNADQQNDQEKSELRRKRTFILDEDSDRSSSTISEIKTTTKYRYNDVKEDKDGSSRQRRQRGLSNKLPIHPMDVLNEEENENNSDIDNKTWNEIGNENGNVDATNDNNDEEDEVTVLELNGVESESYDSGNEDNDPSNSASDDNGYEEDQCQVCSYKGSELFCKRCKDTFHLECLNLRRAPRYGFVCSKCKSPESKKKRKLSSEDEFGFGSSGGSRGQNKKRQRTKKQSERHISTTQPIADRNQNSIQTSFSKRSSLRGGNNGLINHSILHKLLEKAMKNENAWPFLRPVSQSEVPDYYYIIKKPMDFAKVKSKLHMGSYQTNEEVLKDIELIFNNCDEYNIKGNEVYEAGVALEKYIMELCHELNLSFNPSDMNLEEEN